MDGQVPFGCIETQKKNISREGNLTKSRRSSGVEWHYLVVLEGKGAIGHASGKIFRVFLAQLGDLQLFGKR